MSDLNSYASFFLDYVIERNCIIFSLFYLFILISFFLMKASSSSNVSPALAKTFLTSWWLAPFISLHKSTISSIFLLHSSPVASASGSPPCFLKISISYSILTNSRYTRSISYFHSSGSILVSKIWSSSGFSSSSYLLSSWPSKKFIFVSSASFVTLALLLRNPTGLSIAWVLISIPLMISFLPSCCSYPSSSGPSSLSDSFSSGITGAMNSKSLL